jgi:hypothetical protein
MTEDFDTSAHVGAGPDEYPTREPVDAGAQADGPGDARFTGDARVDAAVARLDDIGERDLHEHADVFNTIHVDLADVLDDAGTSGPQA